VVVPSTGFERMNELGKAGAPFLFIIDFLAENVLVYTSDQASQLGIRFSFNEKGNTTLPSAEMKPFTFRKFPVPFRQYFQAFQVIQHHLRAGNSYLINLTCATPIETSLSTEQIFCASSAPYRLFVPGKFVVFSPERFIRVKDDIISTCPMKGTIDATLPDAESRILQDPKELAEHNTIVDLLRNDLSIVAEKVEVKKFRYLEKILTHTSPLLQVSSLIEGELRADFHRKPGDILKQLLPAGSISGAPKQKTVEIIQEAEFGPRGFYTGIFGFYDGYNLDSAVMIRFIEETPAGLVYHSGGGITARSNPETEYLEMIDKVYVPVI